MYLNLGEQSEANNLFCVLQYYTFRILSTPIYGFMIFKLSEVDKRISPILARCGKREKIVFILF